MNNEAASPCIEVLHLFYFTILPIRNVRESLFVNIRASLALLLKQLLTSKVILKQTEAFGKNPKTCFYQNQFLKKLILEKQVWPCFWKKTRSFSSLQLNDFLLILFCPFPFLISLSLFSAYVPSFFSNSSEYKLHSPNRITIVQEGRNPAEISVEKLITDPLVIFTSKFNHMASVPFSLNSSCSVSFSFTSTTTSTKQRLPSSIAPFTIATSRLERMENVAIRVKLSNGCVGWGEAPVLPHVTSEDQGTAMLKAKEACEFLLSSNGRSLSLILGEIGGLLPGHQFASVSLCLGFQF